MPLGGLDPRSSGLLTEKATPFCATCAARPLRSSGHVDRPPSRLRAERGRTRASLPGVVSGYADPGASGAERVAYRGPDPPVTSCNQGYFPVEPEQWVGYGHREVGAGRSKFMEVA